MALNACGAPFFRGSLKPVQGQPAVDRCSQTVAQHDAELELSLGLALLGGPGQPVNGGDIVARDAFSPRIDETKLHLRDGIAAIGERRQQFDGARIVAQGISNERIRQLIGCCNLIEQGDEAAHNERAEAQGLPEKSRAHPCSPVEVPGIPMTVRSALLLTASRAPRPRQVSGDCAGLGLAPGVEQLDPRFRQAIEGAAIGIRRWRRCVPAMHVQDRQELGCHQCGEGE
jgi:hypothetical protein